MQVDNRLLLQRLPLVLCFEHQLRLLLSMSCATPNHLIGSCGCKVLLFRQCRPFSYDYSNGILPTSKSVGILGEKHDRIGKKGSEGSIIPFVRDGNWTFSLWCARMLLGSLWESVPFRNRPRSVVLICTVRRGVDTGPNPHRGWKLYNHSRAKMLELCRHRA